MRETPSVPREALMESLASEPRCVEVAIVWGASGRPRKAQSDEYVALHLVYVICFSFGALKCILYKILSKSVILNIPLSYIW